MPSPKTVNEARALPEMKHGEFRYLGARGLDGDSIIAFVDKDGVSKRVSCMRRTPDGPDIWVKSRF